MRRCRCQDQTRREDPDPVRNRSVPEVMAALHRLGVQVLRDVLAPILAAARRSVSNRFDQALNLLSLQPVE